MKDNNKMFNELNESIQAFVNTPKRRIENILYEILTGEYGQFLLDGCSRCITGKNVCDVELNSIDKRNIYCTVDLDYYDFVRLEFPLKYLRNEKSLKKHRILIGGEKMSETTNLVDFITQSDEFKVFAKKVTKELELCLTIKLIY